MDQKELENKVKKLLDDQGFDIRENQDLYSIRKDGEEVFKALVFSSEEYAEKEVKDRDFPQEIKLFVDQGLSGIKQDFAKIDVSIVKEYNSKDYNLPSFELVGDIAIINELDQHSEDEAVEAILEHHDVKTILLKTNPLSGEFRVGDYRRLYGEETETTHKEHGYYFKVDPTKVYYSERFSTERKRIQRQIQEGEKILVMFAGVGPFAILSAEKADKVVAIEKNPEACNYLKQNIKLNDLQTVIDPECGDVREITPDLDNKFDRIIMPLPGSSTKFLDLAAEKIKENATIHLYTFIENKDFEKAETEVREILDEYKLNFDVCQETRCGYKSPSVDRYCLDIKIK